MRLSLCADPRVGSQEFLLTVKVPARDRLSICETAVELERGRGQHAALLRRPMLMHPALERTHGRRNNLHDTLEASSRAAASLPVRSSSG